MTLRTILIKQTTKILKTQIIRTTIQTKYLKSITNAVKWIRGDVEGESAPNPKLSAAQEILAKESATE